MIYSNTGKRQNAERQNDGTAIPAEIPIPAGMAMVCFIKRKF